MASMRMNYFFIIALAAAIMVHAQDTTAEDENLSTHYIGAAAGFVTGYGLSYRHWFNDKNGAQITLGPYVNFQDNSTEASVSLGLTGLRALYLAPVANLFGYYGAHYFFSYDDRNITGPNAFEENPNSDHWIIAGLGSGIDIHAWRLSFNLMTGLATYTAFGESFSINITGETALYYRW